MSRQHLRLVALVGGWAGAWAFLVGGACSTPYGIVGAPRGLPNAIAQAKQAGFVHLKSVFDWSAIEASQGVFDWTSAINGPDTFFPAAQDSADGIVDAAQAAVIPLSIAVANVPQWARAAGTTKTDPPTSASSVRAFARAAAARYCNRVFFLGALCRTQFGGMGSVEVPRGTR